MGLPHLPSITLCDKAFQHVLLRLLEAHKDAAELQYDVWQFSLQLTTLRAEGIVDTVLRRLVAQGLVAHAREITRSRSKKRSMREVSHLKMTMESCFVLTAKGLDVARQFSCEDAVALNRYQRADLETEQLQTVVPSFVIRQDGCRELVIQNRLVKQFWAQAENQELVLRAFQGQNWPQRIVDPFPSANGIDPKRRLHDTIARLNRKQVNQLIRFHGDGSGLGIFWKSIVENG